jgi:glycosyltransferase involved in cell wall biosynthesis
VLATSYARHNGEAGCTVLLLDDPDERLGDAGEPFRIVRPAEIGLDAFEEMAAMYDTLELATAVKPWFLRHLLERDRAPVAYLDPDMRFYAPIGDLPRLLEHHPFVLNPHVSLSPPPRDGERPDDLTLLACGIYNLGFIGVAPGPRTDLLLDWWSERLRFDCVVDHALGLFVDQRWFDLVHAVVPEFGVLRDPGFNVGHWNLHERDIERREGGYVANGEPLRCFHFSGFDPDRPGELSKHQSRVRLATQPALAELCTEYADELRRHGHGDPVPESPYARLYDRTPLVPVLRHAYRSGAREGAFRSPSPFTREGTDEFLAWMREPARAGAPEGLTRLCLSVHAVRRDLAAAWPDLDGQQARYLVDWVRTHGHDALGVPWHLMPEGDGSLREFGHGAGALFDRLGQLSEVGGHAGVTRYLHALYRRRPDLQAAFPRVEGDDAWRLVDWAYRHGARGEFDELPIPPELLAMDWLSEPVNGGPVSRYLDQLWQRRPDLQSRFPDPSHTGAYADWGRTDGIHEDPVLRTLQGGSARRPWPSRRQGDDSGVPGVNVFGLLREQLGIGEAARLVITALEAGGVPHVQVGAGDSGEPRFGTDLVSMNPEQHWKLLRDTDAGLAARRRTIGFWWWELADAVRVEWRFMLPLLDEIWVATDHVAAAIGQIATVPVTKVRIPVAPGAAAPRSRSDLGLPEGFVFLSVFNHDNTLDRKNPMGTIEAFRAAFAPGDGAALVLKSSNAAAHPAERAKLQAAVLGHPDIHLIDCHLPVAEKNALLAACDCYVSLHRAEGFGLPLAEAMYFGRPTIATAYSGNLEFMTSDNSYLVDHDMREVGPAGEPYYPAEGHWAEPDVRHAATLMRRVFEHRDEAAARGQRAAADMRRDFSPEAAALTMTRRLEEIAQA